MGAFPARGRKPGFPLQSFSRPRRKKGFPLQSLALFVHGGFFGNYRPINVKLLLPAQEFKVSKNYAKIGVWAGNCLNN
jgi:hypothetical protein